MQALPIRLLSIATAMGIACFGSRAAPSGGKLLDDIIKDPGHWDQMCSGASPLDFDVQLPLYTLAARRSHLLSQENLVRLKKSRADVVKELRLRLRKMDFSRSVSSNGKSSKSDLSAKRESPELSLLLEVVLKLEAIETLPELLRLEQQLNDGLVAAETRGWTNLPKLDLDSPVGWKGGMFDEKTYPQKRAVFTVRVFQREFLSVMAALLRQKRVPALLESQLEQKYAQHIKQEAEEPELRLLRKPEDVPTNQRQWISFDPIYDLPVRQIHPDGFIPFSPELRNSIRKFASDYLNEPSNKTDSSLNRK